MKKTHVVINLWLLITLCFITIDAFAYSTTTCLNGETGTCYSTDGSQTDVQAAIDAAAAGGNGTLDGSGNPRNGTFDGPGIYLPAGNFTWSSGIGWNNKNILIKGAGAGTCSPTSSAANCSCNSSVDTCITASGTGLTTFANPTASLTTKMQWRMSNMYVTNSGNNGAVMINSNVNYSLIPSTAAYGFRIDHMTFNYPSASVEGTILVVGPVFGLIDHVNMTNYGEASICTFPIIPSENDYDNTCADTLNALCGAYNYSLGYHPGNATRNLVIEDSKFWTSTAGNGTMFDTFYYGGKVIFRHNQIWNGTFYSHWTGGGNVNGLWLEFYNNVSDGSGVPGNYVMRLQGGATGLLYNNTIKGWSTPTFNFGEDRAINGHSASTTGPLFDCDGTVAMDGNAGDPAAPGWPCFAQTGRGNPGIVTSSGAQVPSAPSFPTYLWNNGTQDACSACTDYTAASCSSCTNTVTITSEAGAYIKSTAHPNGDVDFSKTATMPSGAGTHTLSYTPLTYPHPLANAGPDTTPPVLSGGYPSTTLAYGTTSVSMSLNTDETATCKYGTTPGTAYASIANTFSSTGSTSHSQTLTGLTNGSSTTYYIRCVDGSSNANTSDYSITVAVAASGGGGSPIAVGASSKGSCGVASSCTTTAVTTAASGSTFCLFTIAESSISSFTVSDNKGNTYSPTTAISDSSGAKKQVFCAVNGTGGASHTATVSVGSSVYLQSFFVEVLNATTTSPIDQTTAWVLDTASPYDSDVTGTTSQANELALGFSAIGSVSGTIAMTWGNGFSSVVEETNVDNYWVGGIGKKSLSSIGTTYLSTTSTNSVNAAQHVVTFKEAAGGGDTTAPTIVSVTSSTSNGSYKAGSNINVTVNFSEAVTSTGNVTVTLETGTTDRTCTFTVTNASSGSCTYTVQAGDTSADLTTNSISGTIADASANAMTNFTPTTNLAASSAIVIDTAAPTNQNSVFAASVTKQGGASVTITSASESGGAVWFAPTGTTTFTAGATMTTASGTAISILAPATAGSYKMFVIDAAGNVSAESTATLTVDNTAPTVSNVSSDKTNGSYKAGEVIDIDVTFSEIVTSTGNVTVTLETGVTDRTCTFTVTSATTGTCNYTVQAGDTSSDLTVNSVAGTITDVAGNTLSNTTPTTNLAANKALVIDTTAPSNQNTVFAASTTRVGGGSVTVTSAGETGGAIWFAPSGTSSFTAGTTMTTAGGTATSILAPATEGSYKLFVIDLAGNVSSESTATLTVDNTAPVRSAGSPSGALASGTTSTNMTLTTNENATCKYGTSDVAYASLPSTFTTTGGTSHAQTISGLSDGGSYTYYIRCQDSVANANSTGYTISWTVNTGGDVTPPTINSVTSTKANGSYKVGEVIDIIVTFSEVVTSTGNVVVTLETGAIDRTCSFTVTSSSTGICNYTVQAGDTSSDLTTNSITGVIADASANAMVNFVPASNLAATSALVIDTTAPSNQNTVFSSSVIRVGGGSVTVTSAGETGGAIWFAPTGTTTFTAGSTMTTAGGTATSILAPATAGAYKLFVIDLAGNVSPESTATLTVDNTAPARSGGAPSGALASGTTSTVMSLVTDENATCKYGTSDVAYASLPSTFTTTGSTTHSQTVSGLSNGGSYSYYIRCQDSVANVNSTGYLIAFTVATGGSSPTNNHLGEGPRSGRNPNLDCKKKLITVGKVHCR